MQMFFLKNIVSVFIAALMFTAISVGMAAVQRMPASEGNLDVISQSDASLAPTDLPPPPAEPMPAPDQKVMEELKKLDILPEDEEDMPPEGAESAPTVPDPEPDVAEPELPNNQPSAGAEEVPVYFGASLDAVRPNLIKATLNFDNDDKPSPPKTDTDKDDPTSEGTGPGGKHKGGPKIVKFESIPIIKMGGEQPLEGGLKVITPQNS